MILTYELHNCTSLLQRKKAQNCEVVVNILLQEKKWKLRKVTVLLRQAHGETAGQD